MANVCAICGKTSRTGHKVSFSDKKSKRRFMPNLQRLRILHQGVRRRVKVCTACIRAGKVQRV